MNRLYKTLTYLCGPMDRVSWEQATGWRDMIKPHLCRMNIGVIDPCDKPSIQLEDPMFRTQKSELKSVGDFKGLHKLMKPVVNEDMRFVDLSHFLIFYLDSSIHISGGYMEAFQASAYQKKPVLAMIEGGLKNIPDWWCGVNVPEHNFESWEDLINYIKYVDSCTLCPETYNRWQFLDMRKVYNEV